MIGATRYSIIKRSNKNNEEDEIFQIEQQKNYMINFFQDCALVVHFVLLMKTVPLKLRDKLNKNQMEQNLLNGIRLKKAADIDGKV